MDKEAEEGEDAADKLMWSFTLIDSSQGEYGKYPVRSPGRK